MTKSNLAVILSVSMAAGALTGTTVFAGEVTSDYNVPIGISAYYLTVPGGYKEGDCTDAERADDMVAYYYSDDSTMDFDLYQFAKDGKTLEDYAKEECDQYSGTDLTASEINGIPVESYKSVEAYDGTDYNVISYLFEDNENFMEVCFWLDGDTAAEEADAIIQTLAMDDTAVNTADAAVDFELALGTSALSVIVPAGYVEGERTPEDRADDQVAYYYSNNSLMDFDIYQFAKDGKTLEDYAKEECDQYSGTDLTTSEINGIPVVSYKSVETYDILEYNVINYLFESGDDFVEICFWLDGDIAAEEVDAIIQTLAVASDAEITADEAAAQ